MRNYEFTVDKLEPNVPQMKILGTPLLSVKQAAVVANSVRQRHYLTWNLWLHRMFQGHVDSSG